MSDIKESISQLQQNFKDQTTKSLETLDYIQPFWSSKPLYNFSFEIMKEGIIIDNIDLSEKEFYLFGRQEDVCDIALDNPTASRKHAVIQHKDTGEIFIYDLGSTHGTYLNKKAIPPKQYMKMNVGDMVKFGQSSRWFILDGPEDLQQDSETDKEHQRINVVSKKQNQDHLLKKRAEKVKQFSEQMKMFKNNQVQKLQGDEEVGISWGMDFVEEEIQAQQKKQEEEGDENEDSREDQSEDEDEDVKLLNIENLKQRTDLSDRQKQMLNKIEGIRRNFKKLLDKRSQFKSQEEVEFNEKAITGKLKGLDKKCLKVKQQLEKEEAKLKTSLKSKKTDKQNKEKESEKDVQFKYYNSDDEEDEFFDRTKYTTFHSTQKQEKDDNGVETYETIKSKLEDLYRQRQKLTEEIQGQSRQQQSELQKQEEEDELEAYMKQNETQIRKDKLTKLSLEMNQINQDIEKYSRLIAMVAPASFMHNKPNKPEQSLESTSTLKTENKQEQEPIQQQKDHQKKHSKHQASGIGSAIQKLKELQYKREEEEWEKKRQEEEIQRQQDEQILQQRIAEYDQLGENQEDYEDSNIELEEDSGLKNYFKEIVKNANKSGEKIDLSKYQHLIKEYDNTANKRTQNEQDVEQLEQQFREPDLPKRRKEFGVTQIPGKMNLQNDTETEKRMGEVDDWVPPLDQAGDGKTKLNEKYGY